MILYKDYVKATSQCARGKRHKKEVSQFYRNSFISNERLKREVDEGQYKISKYVEFKIYEPKERDILAPRFRDRVFWRTLINNGLREDLTKSFVHDNVACQIGKGTLKAIERTIAFLQKYYRKHGRNGYVQHWDIKKFYPSTPHKLSYEIIDKYVREEYRQYARQMVDSFKDIRPQEEIDNDEFGERGNGLGCEAVQLLQLAIYNEIDHVLKEKYHIKYYVRYNDDWLIMGEDQKLLDEAFKYVEEKSKSMGLTIIKKSSQPLTQTFVFLRKRFTLKENGRVLVLPKQDKIANIRSKLRGLKKKLEKGDIEFEKIQAYYRSVSDFLLMYDCKAMVRKLDSYYCDMFNTTICWERKKNNVCKCRRTVKERAKTSRKARS